MGLTLHQHRIIRAFRRKQCADFTNEKELVKARDAFLDASAELLMRSNTRRRPRLARNQGGGNVEQPTTSPDIQEFKRIVVEPTSYSEFGDILAEDTAPEVPDLPDEPQSEDSASDVGDDIDQEVDPKPTPATEKPEVPLFRYRSRDGDSTRDDSSSTGDRR